MRKASRQEVQKAIHEGIVFRKSKNQGFEDDKVRTKAKKKLTVQVLTVRHLP